MAASCLLYYITDRKQFPGGESSRRAQLLDKIAEAGCCGIDYVQLREKDLSSRELEQLARDVLDRIRENSPIPRSTRLLINSRCDIALAVGADGVHLRSDDVSVEDARQIVESSDSRNLKPESQNWIIGVSCHAEEEVARAAAAHANFAVFAPVFEKKALPETTPTGLARLRHACEHDIPVLALGGITVQNAVSCVGAGAAGIAAIRLFQENNIAEVVRQVRIGCA